MNPGCTQRRGVTLVVVVMVMTVVTGMLVILAACGASHYRARQAQRVRLVAQTIADSAADYARMQFDAWSRTPPEQPVQLDVADLLPPKMTGSATITVLTINGQKVCRISTRVNRAIYTASDQIDLEFE